MLPTRWDRLTSREITQTGRHLFTLLDARLPCGMSTFPPFLTTSGFHPDAVYRINIDNDGSTDDQSR
jgi:hypothetical protein